jgi:hypothetical protein
MNGLPQAAFASGLVIAPLCAAGIILATRRRLVLGFLFGTYVGSGLTVGAMLGVRVGLGILLTGFVCALVLAAGTRRGTLSSASPGRTVMPQGVAFRTAAALLVASAAWGLAAQGGGAGIPISPTHLGSSAVVLGMGLLLLGLSQDKESAAMGLLTALGGFEMVYAALEPSLAMRAVLAALMIGISLVASLDPEAPTPARGEERRAI